MTRFSEGPRSGEDSRQSPFHSDASACRKSRRIKHETQCPELPYFRRSRNFIFAAAGIFLLSVAALAASPPINVRGTIAQVDGNTIDIKERDGGVAKIQLADNAKIVSVAKASLSDVKPGSFIGTAATPGTDGKLQAIEVHIFPESMRGTGEGDRAWDLTPKSSMTNGTVAPKSSMTNGTVAEKSDKLPSAKTEPLRQCNLRRENRTGRVRALAHASPPSRRSGSRFAFDRAGFRQAYQSV